MPRSFLSLSKTFPANPSTFVSKVEVTQAFVCITFFDGEKILVQPSKVEEIKTELNGLPIHGRVRFARVSVDGNARSISSTTQRQPRPSSSLPRILYDRIFYAVFDRVTKR